MRPIIHTGLPRAPGLPVAPGTCMFQVMLLAGQMRREGFEYILQGS